ncbi:hypothetical protein AMATHDRAFT_54995 [Amanita thiersii Skay4041]|uniref:Uncharacterized protein n=1 Tax=Amanita thiersii Skay4041 TaxID=703135 RepID=A0A2A9NRU4_9AGAR|nr:hypothetical protein AMATHDRAFT_54995 [Amanita thiersii Skay4041]
MKFSNALLFVFTLQTTALTLAMPTQDSTVLHCAIDGKTCPQGWTCCGPILEGVGGTCRLLRKDEVCAL